MGVLPRDVKREVEVKVEVFFIQENSIRSIGPVLQLILRKKKVFKKG
jgi:hypothetical protein